mmetsp:Transcript_32944/g.72800  ORF Transcript_32944/g.72800 Transcript_32944/m.72800 type:complete len:242 (+) Transcript_32944:941-1666(+)
MCACRGGGAAGDSSSSNSVQGDGITWPYRGLCLDAPQLPLGAPQLAMPLQQGGAPHKVALALRNRVVQPRLQGAVLLAQLRDRGRPAVHDAGALPLVLPHQDAALGRQHGVQLAGHRLVRNQRVAGSRQPAAHHHHDRRVAELEQCVCAVLRPYQGEGVPTQLLEYVVGLGAEEGEHAAASRHVLHLHPLALGSSSSLTQCCHDGAHRCRVHQQHGKAACHQHRDQVQGRSPRGQQQRVAA